MSPATILDGREAAVVAPTTIAPVAATEVHSDSVVSQVGVEDVVGQQEMEMQVVDEHLNKQPSRGSVASWSGASNHNADCPNGKPDHRPTPGTKPSVSAVVVGPRVRILIKAPGTLTRASASDDVKKDAPLSSPKGNKKGVDRTDSGLSRGHKASTVASSRSPCQKCQRFYS